MSSHPPDVSTSTPRTNSTQRSLTLVTPSQDDSIRRETLSVEPVTDEMFDKAAGCTVSNRPKGSSRRPTSAKPTMLTFQALQEQPDVAKCQLVLCNISERVLHFRLKSSSGSNIISVPFGNGHIAPHAQIRLTLTWSRADKYQTWTDAPIPKLILTTRFLDEHQPDSEPTHTRLVAKLGKKMCTAASPPVEQLLLDAAKALQPEVLDEPEKKENNMGQTMADFVNNLSDRGILVLILILAIAVILLTGGRQR